MIEINNNEASMLYEKIRKIFLQYETQDGFEYKKDAHHLYEPNASKELREHFYNEFGQCEFKNINGDTVLITIKRWHVHQHNGWSGLNINPCLRANIAIKDSETTTCIWELIVDTGTLYYKAKTTSLELPTDILIQPENNKTSEEDTPSDAIKPDTTPLKIDGNIFDGLNEIHKKLITLESAKKGLLQQRDKDLESAKEKIFAEYQQRLSETDNKIKSATEEEQEFATRLITYSSFNTALIGMAIAQLLSIIEGDDFTYQTAIHKTKKVVHGPIDSWEEDIVNTIKMIVKRNQAYQTYTSPSIYESTITKLVKNGGVIILSEESYYSSKSETTTFYRVQDGKIVCTVDFGSFTYIQEFIDMLIQYRYQRAIDEISENDIISLMKQFLTTKRESIITSYTTKIAQKILEWNPKLAT